MYGDPSQLYPMPPPMPAPEQFPDGSLQRGNQVVFIPSQPCYTPNTPQVHIAWGIVWDWVVGSDAWDFFQQKYRCEAPSKPHSYMVLLSPSGVPVCANATELINPACLSLEPNDTFRYYLRMVVDSGKMSDSFFGQVVTALDLSSKEGLIFEQLRSAADANRIKRANIREVQDR
jgi:hypothetical protein